MRFSISTIVFLAFCWKASNADTSQNVRINVLRVKRSISENQAEKPSYQVHVDGLPEKVKLDLRQPTQSIFTPSFQYLEASENLHFEDSSPTKEELKEIEQSFFLDVDSNAAVSLKQNPEGNFRMNGRINEMSIIHQEEDNNNNVHTVMKRSADEVGLNDYIDLHRKTFPALKGRSASFSITKATPEVLVVWDHENSKQFGYDRTKILDYIGVFFHAVNNRFATSKDPIISFRIAGVISIKSESEQPYMEDNKVSGGGYHGGDILASFSKWIYSNSAKIPKYDMAALITGTDIKLQNSIGQYVSGLAGLAYLKGTCLKTSNQNLGSSVSEDRGGYYEGVFTVAHELAHNLGSDHDGNGDASACPWQDGYIMSYEGWGTKNKFYFSKCSLKSMKDFIDSSGGYCTKSNQGGSKEVSVNTDEVGTRVTMKELCQKYTKNANAIPDPKTKPGDLCKNLKCQYTVPYLQRYQRTVTQTLNLPPGDYTACGNGGKCINGDCIGSMRSD